MNLRTILIVPALALLLAATPPPPSGRDIDTALAKAYAPYLRVTGGDADWSRAVWSAKTKTLIRAWRKHIGGELTGLSDYSWLCDCQDWDAEVFAWRRTAMTTLGPGRVSVTVRVTVAKGSVVVHRLVLVREGKVWLIDDLFNRSDPKGVKSGLHSELAIPKNKL